MKKNFKLFTLSSIHCLAIIFILFISACSTNEIIIVNDLMTEYLNDPLGVDIPNPRFTWKLSSGSRGIRQEAYQVTVSSSKRVLKNQADIWDSGRILSDRSVNIEYEGVPLESNRVYYWRICIWTNTAKKIYSKTGNFPYRNSG